MKLNTDMLDVMRKATKLLQQGRNSDATSTIQRVLQQVLPGAAGTPGAAREEHTQSPMPMKDINPPPVGRENAAQPRRQETVEPVPVHQTSHGIPDFVADLLERFVPNTAPRNFSANANNPSTAAGTAANHSPRGFNSQSGGAFLSGTFANAAGSRNYKLYVPASYSGQRVPLVVMLHGCTQNPDDFAAGTEMNRYAEDSPCLVLYPEQTSSANSSKCWNWFKAMDQQRGQGEPSIIADMTRDIIANYAVDPSQVYVAGLSAGGAMAAIMGSTYPDVYAAVGIHSGLPYAAATDLPSAMQAMRAGMNEAKSSRAQPSTRPIIVFHGDRDTTVHPRNGEQLIAQNVRNPRNASVVNGTEPGGLHYTRTIHAGDDGRPVAEQWLIHGAGHAWSGGSSAGSYTEGRGPQATREMMRFFSTRHAQV